MANTFDARMEFYFKGEKYDLSATIDVDEYMNKEGSLPPLYTLLARANGIDPYSYQYEVMEMEQVTFANTTGYVSDYLVNDVLDLEGLKQRWREEKVINIISAIAKRSLDIDDLTQHPQLLQALREAYQSGQSSQ